jgi:DNA helicase-2/ATP-dependent DNA helicase PcrA
MTLRLIPANDNQSAEDLLNGLNEQQAEAVRTTEGPVLIIAGAGSGKTRVLTYRIAYMLRLGVHPSHVLALTFTNKAAQEMRERISHLVGNAPAAQIWAGTFHSIFARMLRVHAEKIGYSANFTIYDADDQLAAIKAVMNALGVSQQVLPPNAVRSRISNAKNEMKSWQEYTRTANTIVDKQSAQIYEQYEKRLTQSNAMDFDDLLLNMIRLLERHPDVLDSYHERFKYLMVDEYQDTNRAQYRVVNLLAQKYRNICVVGDDAQSIYRWRGAEIRNILDFERDYREAKTVRLEQNYRSTKTILAAADSVIKKNRSQLKKELWTDNIEGEKITLLACRDDREEAESVARTIRSRIESRGLRFSDVAVLYRTNAQSQALEDALRRINMPYNIVSGVSFYKRKEVKDAIAYLRLLVNPSDTESILRVINEPARGIGATSLQHMQDHARATDRPLIDVLRHAGEVPSLQKRMVTAVQDFVKIIDDHRALAEELSPASLAQAYLESTGLLQFYKNQNTEEALDRWNNIDRLLSHIMEQQELDETLTLSRYLEQVSLVSDQDDPQLGSNRVSMMTMHAAKGLEFPLVVIAGMEQGLFPLAKAEQDPAEQEEERRLFYVGITRARQELVLAYAERRYRFGEMVFSRPSMFLAEIDPTCFAASSRVMQRDAGPSLAQRPAPPKASPYGSRQAQPTRRPGPPARGNEYSQVPSSETYGQVPSDMPNYRTGMRVKHPMFGVGTIVGLAGVGQQAKATVQFSNGAKKQLMLMYARLEIV